MHLTQYLRKFAKKIIVSGAGCLHILATAPAVLPPLLLLTGSDVASAVEVADVRLPDSVSFDGNNLPLHGYALRRWGPARLYVIGLYTEKAERGSASAGTVTSGTATSGAAATPADPKLFNVPGAKRVTLVLMRDLTARQLSDALNEGIRDNHEDARYAALQPRIERLIKVMREVGSARSGSRLHIDFLPGQGTRVALDDNPKGELIEGEDFYLAILRIWLGPRPPDPALKEALLGPSTMIGTR
jgi:hypothetical protein